MIWRFRCLQGKEARQTAKKAVQKGRRKEKKGVGVGAAQDQTATNQFDQAARRRPHQRPAIVERNSVRRDESEREACWEVALRARTA
jgi:hypothetical protein